MKPSSFGAIAACLAANVHPDSLPELAGMCAGFRKSANSQQFGRMLAGFARDIYIEADEANSIERHVFEQLTKVASWEPEHFDYVEPVLLALSTVKAAAGEGGGILSAIPEGARMMLGGSALAGGALGTLNWALNRDANEDDAKSKSIAARTAYYKNLANEISRELKTSPQPAVRRMLRNTMHSAENRITDPSV
jgi:hypothetical protein